MKTFGKVSQAAVRKMLYEKLFRKMSKNLQEFTCAGVKHSQDIKFHRTKYNIGCSFKVWFCGKGLFTLIYNLS